MTANAFATSYILVEPAKHWPHERWTGAQAAARARELGSRVVSAEVALAETRDLVARGIAEAEYPRAPGDWIERYDRKSGKPLGHFAPLD